MRFVWDPKKARSNRAKHGVSFAEAATTFADPLALFLEDKHHPERAILIGQSEASRLVFTVYVEIHDDLIRIVSARRATPLERRTYEEASDPRGPSRMSLREMPEVDLAGYVRRKNPFAERIAKEGIEIAGGAGRGRSVPEPRPSKASLREMPEVDLATTRPRRNPYAQRITSEGISLQIGRGRPRRGTEVGVTAPRSIRLPARVWELLAQRAEKEGIPLHASLRAAVLDWLNRVA